ncbi:flavodoxin [Bifidobacterium lemurum]|nr:flavodoxin [Bifidobacterium lemurum]
MSVPTRPSIQRRSIMTTLVAYYSAEGYTKRVAETIADATGADLFEIIPADPYTDTDLDWRDANSRVVREHDDPTLRETPLDSAAVPDWDSYDTVLIGYPIWWGIAAWPVNGFVTDNDFAGKTVVPFCTSASSPLGDSDTRLAALADAGDWRPGHRFQSAVSDNDVRKWVESLGI